MEVMTKEKIGNSALDVAKYIICVALNNGDSITNLKLQKLLYYAQAWYLVNNDNEKLFEDKILAWPYGPVVQVVYDEYKNFGRSPILIDDCDLENPVDNLKESVKNYLDEFCETFFKFSATELVTMTHREKPWVNAILNGYGSEISTELMYNFYTNMLNNEKE